MKASHQSLLLIFTRNPELGKCKTRLARAVGDQKALQVYQFLLEHTVKVTKNLNVAKQVYYSEEIWKNDIWPIEIFDKKLQQGTDLGARMYNAFHTGFEKGYQHIIVIGSDLFDLQQEELEHAFEQLKTHDFVIGPAEDGGYYLLGMNYLNKEVFANKAWGTPTVLEQTLDNLSNHTAAVLPPKNDVDYLEDIQDIPEFQSILNKEL